LNIGRRQRKQPRSAARYSTSASAFPARASQSPPCGRANARRSKATVRLRPHCVRPSAKACRAAAAAATPTAPAANVDAAGGGRGNHEHPSSGDRGRSTARAGGEVQFNQTFPGPRGVGVSIKSASRVSYASSLHRVLYRAETIEGCDLSRRGLGCKVMEPCRPRPWGWCRRIWQQSVRMAAFPRRKKRRALLRRVVSLRR
jgi:hypothetical protein